MFIEMSYFRDLDPEKHRKCSTSQKSQNSRYLLALRWMISQQWTSLQDMGRTIILHMQSSQQLLDKALSVKSTSIVLSLPHSVYSFAKQIVFIYNEVMKGR